jgi:hypothetical protein
LRTFLIAVLLLAQQKANLASLIQAADVIVVAQISGTDYSQTPSDGPMTAHAKVLSALKGGLQKDQTFGFAETAWVGPNYQTGEVRILFLQSAGPNSFRILPNLYARTDFFVAQDALRYLNLNSLRSVLEKMPAPTAKSVLITRDMLK